MVMEKCTDGFLQGLESMPEITERELGDMVAQMLLGISHCHSARVCHRDIKPDNFLFGMRPGSADGTVVKVADFGLSAPLPKQGKLHGVYGTAPYMCPEMLMSEQYDAKADVWSLAVVVYVLIFGVFPYMPEKQSSKAMKVAIIEGATLPSFRPKEQRSNAPNAHVRSEQAVSFVKSLLQRKPDQRPTAEESLQSQWISDSMKGSHMSDSELPSLRPMIYAAKKVGAFEVRTLAQDKGATSADVCLDHLQMSFHGTHLPGVEGQPASRGARDPQGMPSIKEHRKERFTITSGSTEAVSSDSDSQGSDSNHSYVNMRTRSSKGLDHRLPRI
jgi:serine/threonine protein kinase